MCNLSRGLRVTGAVSLCLAVVGGPAHADTAVVECYVGARPADTDEYMAIVLADLAARGHRLGVADLGRELEAVHSHPARSGETTTIDERLPRLVDSGYQAWLDGDFNGAIFNLSHAIQAARRESGAIVEKKERRDLVGRALTGLGLSHKRLKHADDSLSWSMEILRGFFAEDEIDRTNYGPEALELFRAARKIAAGQRPGALAVSVDDKGVMIFVNEVYAGLGKARLEDLIPGNYRVLVRKGDLPGRVYRVTVAPGQTTRVNVEWAFDGSLHTAPRWVGHLYASEAMRADFQVAHVAHVARLVGADTVIVLTIGIWKGHRSLIGAAYSAYGGPLFRSGAVPIEPVPPSPKRLRGLAAFLAGEINELPDDPPSATASASSSSRYGWVKWSTAGATVATAVAGIWLLSIDGKSRCPNGNDGDACYYLPYESTFAGYATLGASVALGAVTTYLFVRDPRKRRGEKRLATKPLITGSGAILVVEGAF